MKAEGAFLDHPVGPGREGPLAPNTPIRRQVGTKVFLFLLLDAVEASRSIRAGDDTVFASEASPEVLHYNPVFPTIGCLGRADGDARSVVALHTRHGDQLGIDLGIFPGGRGNDLVPKDIPSRSLFFRRSVRDVVLRLTGCRAGLAAHTFVQINHHSPSWHHSPRVRLHLLLPLGG